MFGKSFSQKNICIQTENEAIAYLYAEGLASVCGVYVDIKSSGYRKNSPKKLYISSIPDEEQRKRVFDTFGHSFDDLSIRINRANFTDECCIKSFIKGAFLVAGWVTDPRKEYHLEFVTSHRKLSSDFSCLLDELLPKPKTVIRKSSVILYYKESENIEDILTLCDATLASMQIMNVKIEKDIRNKVNRITNCETANISKTADASASQLLDIQKIIDANMFDALSEELWELATLRIENPEMSLRELGQALSNQLSRSGINHRLEKLSRIASEIKGK